MAVSLRVSSASWTELEADGSVAIPATPSVGDRMFLFTAWKDYAITAQVSGWTEIAEWADGTVSSANNVGSVKVACWYKDYTGAGDPTVDFSSDPTNSASAILVMNPGTGAQFTTPSYVTAALSWGTGSTTTSASSTTTVPTGGVVMALCGIRNDTATFTRGANGLDAASGVTFDTYVEAPATHYSDTTGHDIAADLGFRLVTSGGTGITLRVTGTLSATETGAALWIVQGVQTATSATAQAAAAGTGAAYTSGKTVKASAGAAAATGAAQQATGRPGTRGLAVLAEATGAAANTTGKVKASAGAAAATGAAADTWAVDQAGAAAATGAAEGTDATVGATSVLAAATGSALDATADTSAEITFDAEVATGVAAAILVNANLNASAGYARARSA